MLLTLAAFMNKNLQGRRRQFSGAGELELKMLRGEGESM